MNRESIIMQLKIYENEFRTFMNIEKFPVYELQTQEVSQNIADTQGFEVGAATFYRTQNKSHSLLISTNLTLSKYLIFHEFTHMLDSEMYVNGDSGRYAGLSGFTEYHASQVELMQLLGASTFNQVPSFSMDTIITTLAGEKSVSQYVREKQQHAIELFSRADFPADLNTLKSAVGILFNYFGLRSICEMYAIDFSEEVNNQAFLKYISTYLFVALNNLMHGWLDEEKIELSINIYINIIFPLIKEFKLA